MNNLIHYIENRSSSAYHAIRCFARLLYCLDKWKFKAKIINTMPDWKLLDYLKIGEYKIISSLHSYFFSDEIKALSKQQKISVNSKIIQLKPFIDKYNIIRTSGRLQACKSINFNTKHQIILPKCNFTYNLIRDIHEANLHSTKISTLSFIGQKYCPIYAKSIINRVIHQCIICFKSNPTNKQQIMGDLPLDRVNASFPFVKVSIDYAGPIDIKASKLRTAAPIKSYVALFKCLTTKAIHLELVTDLSSKSFIATLDRFISRRRLPTDIYSDNATYFEGANNEFKKIMTTIQSTLQNYFDKKSIKWHFSTPRAPHMGGFWESGIKQMKYYLKRILEDKLLKFEEMYTLICRIESILNSRPITELSDNPEDFEALTPGHFIIGRPLNCKLKEKTDEIKSSYRNRWNLIQQIQQFFWKQGYNNLINNQIRPKNFQIEASYKINDLVLIKDVNTPTMKWKLGRIIGIFKGKYGISRNIKIKTDKGEIERHVNYVYKLPLD